MKRKYQNQSAINSFPAMMVACLSLLISLAQPAMAAGPFESSGGNISFGDFAVNNLLSPQAVLVVNTAGDQNDQLPGDGFCNDGAGNCSLRAAIQEANAFAGAQTIDFNIPGACPQTITPGTPLPDISDSVTIDGFSQTGALANTATTTDNAVVCLLLNGVNAGSSADGFHISAVNTTIRGFAIGNFGFAGIESIGSGGVIEGNRVGTNAAGTAKLANFHGVIVYGSNSRVGGTTLAARNIISGNTRFGIIFNQPASGNFAQNNFVGVSAPGAALGNGESGINVFRSSGNTIGGATAAARNIISGNGVTASGGNDGSGISLFGSSPLGQPVNNTIQGNYIGTNPAGTAALGNKHNGIRIEGGVNTIVAGNVVSGNLIDGIGITGTGATGNIVKGNTVGLDPTNLSVLGNARDGVSIYQVGGNTIGGTGAGDRNWIAGNKNFGIFISGAGAEDNGVLGNYIGFDANNAGTAQPNGVVIWSPNNVVGGTTAAARNYISAHTGTGVSISFSGSNIVTGNYVGIVPTGAPLGNTYGVAMLDSSGNTIGGTAAGAGNVISGNLVGLTVTKNGAPASNNLIQGNLIGTNPAGTAAVSNIFQGIIINAASANTIGGTTAAARNIISGSGSEAIEFYNGATNNLVQGNYIGTRADGSAALGNSIGVVISGVGTTGNVVGGTATGAGNVISGNSSNGVQINSNASANRVEGNIIGLKADGSGALPNASGIGLNGNPSANIIGGTTAGAGNVISGNTDNGIVFGEGANNNSVLGNKIGTDAAGTNAFPNTKGIKISTGPANLPVSSNMIGGATAGARNIISGNSFIGISVEGPNSSGNTISGNYIGTKADGAGALSNGQTGVALDAATVVGGPTPAEGNVISGQTGNAGDGIAVTGNVGFGTVIQNNLIGPTADGGGVIGNFTGIELNGNYATIDSNVIAGNSFCGICIQAVPNGGFITNNKIGTNAAGTALLGNGVGINITSSSLIKVGLTVSAASAPNIIAGSSGYGARVFGNSSAGNTFYHNSIYSNGGLGIDLRGDGVTQNDAQDTDNDANGLQNFPIINVATTTISGNFNSTPNRQFRLEFYSSGAVDPSGYGEGQTFLTQQTVMTDASGNATFSVSNPQPLGTYITATATDAVTSDTSEFSGAKQTLAPTAVKFNGARATAFDRGVLVEWQTGRESDNLGFNVYRESRGTRELVTANLIAGSALTASENLLSEQNYSWFDADGDTQSVYYIESIDISGVRELFGAYPAEKSLKATSERYNSPTLNELGRSEAFQTSAAISQAAGGEISAEPVKLSKVQKSIKPANAQSKEIQDVLAANPSVKLAVRRSGFYRVTAGDLPANGLPADTPAANLRLYAGGIEQPINVTGAENGVFGRNSAIEFYGTGMALPETDTQIYYLVAAATPGLRMQKADTAGQPATAANYQAVSERRDRTLYFSGLLNGDAENFFGAVVSSAGVDQTINAAQIDRAGGRAEITVSLQGVTNGAHLVGVELNGQSLGTIDFDRTGRGQATFSISAADLQPGENTVKLRAAGAGDVSVIDFIRLTYPHLYQAENNSLSLSASGGQEITAGSFTSKDIRVFDVTEPNAVFEIAARLQKSPGADTVDQIAGAAEKTRGFAFKFTAAGSGTRRLLAVSAGQAGTVESVAFDGGSNLRDRRNAADLLILTKREFFPALAPLVGLRQSQGLKVSLVDVSDIYDEFSFGRKSTAAIREFLNYAGSMWRQKPQYVLFGGDATYDPKGYLGNSSADVVPAKLVDTESIETASDEWLADTDGDGVGELAVGRLPARTAAEMTAMVTKITNYERQPKTDAAVFVADINDGGFDYAAANKGVFSLLPSSYHVTDIRRENANAKTQLMSAVNAGQSIVSYSGHGSESIWRGNLLNNADAAGMTNSEHLPVFLMMTCLNGYFQDVSNDSLSEALLKNPNGGAAAVWASSGTTTPDVETELNREFIRSMSAGNLTLGQIVRTAKLTVVNRTLRQTWTLLGDPAMRLR